MTLAETDAVSYRDDPLGYEARLRAKLTPQRIRSTMSFAALYQMTHEMIQKSVLEEVHQFFRTGFADHEWVVDNARYAADVLSRDQNRFRASLGWLIEMGAVSTEQAEQLDGIYAHRHELTHELIKYIVDPDAEPDVDAFVRAVTILEDISRFWTEVEAGYGTFEDHPDVDLDEIVPLSMMVLQQCIDAYIDGLDGESSPQEPDRPGI